MDPIVHWTDRKLKKKTYFMRLKCSFNLILACKLAHKNKEQPIFVSIPIPYAKYASINGSPR